MKRFRRLFLPTFSCLMILSALAAFARESSPPVPSDGRGPQEILIIDGSPVHNVGSLWVRASNWGAIGSMPGSEVSYAGAPSAEWPAGSGIEYLYVAGLWVGGLRNGVPAVSTAAYQFEFRADQDARDIVYRSAFAAPHGARIPSIGADDDGDGLIDEDRLDGYDNDGDGKIDEDYAAISDQMFSRVFCDDTPEATQIYPQHDPLHLEVHEESNQFRDPDYDDFVGFTFWITNTGTETIDGVYIGMFADGDVGSRQTGNYWEDDRTGFAAGIPVDHGAHGVSAYDFAYWYDDDGDGGLADGWCGFVILDHPTDPAGDEAPSRVGIVSYMPASGSAVGGYGEPSNDLERYQFMASHVIRADPDVPRDYRTYFAVGPFAHLEPGETIPFTFALVVTPRGDFANVQRAVEAYQGQWFDLDHNPATGIDGKEHQEHWYLPADHPIPLTITYFGARPRSDAVNLRWDLWQDTGIAGFELLRARGDQPLRSLLPGLLPADMRTYVDKNVEPGVRYRYQVRAYDDSGSVAVSQQEVAYVPSPELILRQNAPNPFTAATTVSFSLPAPAEVALTVYDVNGRRVATVYSGQQDAGEHEFQWNGYNDNGDRVGTGIYFCRIQSGARTLTRKMVLMR